MDRNPPSSTMTVPLAKTYFSEPCRQRIADDIDRILSSGKLMMGAYTDKFESAFSELVGTPHAVSVNSCTTALTICLKYFGVEGYEVLVPAGSFVTDVSAVTFAGGTPVLVDMNPETLSFDLADLQRKITPRTKGMIWVHLTGIISPEHEDILGLCRNHGLFVLEDASHAHGASVDGSVAGALGDAGCFSFYPTKILTSGTGGMITTRDAALRKFAEEMRLFGKEAGTGEIIHLGNDWFLDEIRACVGYHHLTELGDQLARRRAIAARYDAALRNQPGISILTALKGNLSAYYQYPVFMDPHLSQMDVVNGMKARGIQVKSIYRPVHHEKVFRHFDDGTLGKTEQTLNRSVCLPMFYELTDDQIEAVSERLVAEVRSLL